MPFHVFPWRITTLREAKFPHGALRCPFQGTQRHIAMRRVFRVGQCAGHIPVQPKRAKQLTDCQSINRKPAHWAVQVACA